MRRRDLMLAPLWVQAALAQSEKPREWVTATASRDTAPRVGLIPSSFTGGEEMDGKKIRGLTKPAPLTASLSESQLDGMLRLAVELGGGRRGGLITAIGPEDWVVIKPCIARCPGGEGFHAGMMADPRLVASVLRYLAEKGRGKRFTIAEAAPCLDASYGAMVQTLSKRHPAVRFELVDLNSAPAIEATVVGRVFTKRNPQGVYHVARVLRECDKVISIAPLSTRAGTGVALSVMNYLGFAVEGRSGAVDEAAGMAMDLFSFHPADYAIVGGPSGAESDGTATGGTRLRQHNVIVAGTNAPAVDAVAAAVMGFESTSIQQLEFAVRRGLGLNDASSIWTRGSEIEDVRAAFRPHPS